MKLPRRYHNVGILVLFLHDINDIQLEFTKLNIYMKSRGGGYHLLNDVLSNMGSVSFSITWWGSTNTLPPPTVIIIIICLLLLEILKIARTCISISAFYRVLSGSGSVCTGSLLKCCTPHVCPAFSPSPTSPSTSSSTRSSWLCCSWTSTGSW